MPDPRAILVDDDPQQVVEASSAIADAGYAISVYNDMESVLARLAEPIELIDLFVLDRKLPMRAGETAADELGDQLFQVVRDRYPDSRVIVFSGYTDFDHLQSLMEGAGPLIEAPGARIDRVSVLRKSQFDRFETHLVELRQLLQRIEDVDITHTSSQLTPLARRIVRRVGLHYSATTASVRELSGGLTDAGVWECSLSGPSGEIAHVVVKQAKNRPSAGGLQDLLPGAFIAPRMDVVSGLMSGYTALVLQLAGDSPVSVMHLIGEDPSVAGSGLEPLISAMDARWSTVAATSIRLDDLVTPLISWGELVERLVAHGVPVPAASLWITTRFTMSHGDLHPANILMCSGSPRVIDSDGSRLGPGLLDPITLQLSTLTHPASPILGAAWLSVEHIERSLGDPDFGSESRAASWFGVVGQWVVGRKSSDREYWGLALAWAARQLEYDNVVDDPPTLSKVLTVARRASLALAAI